MFSRIPGFLVHYVLRAMSFLLYTLNLDMTMMGLFASTLSSLDSIFLTDFMRVIVSLD